VLADAALPATGLALFSPLVAVGPAPTSSQTGVRFGDDDGAVSRPTILTSLISGSFDHRPATTVCWSPRRLAVRTLV